MKRTTGKISFGKEISKFEVEGFVLTETVHSPSLVLPRHDHELANINFTINGSFRETFGRRPQECCASSLLIKPAAEVHANEYGAKGAHCLIIELPGRRLASFRAISSLFEKPELIENAFLACVAMNIYRELHASGGPSPLLIEGLVLELLAHAGRLQPSGRLATSGWLDDARCLMHKRFAEKLSLSSVAEQMESTRRIWPDRSASGLVARSVLTSTAFGSNTRCASLTIATNRCVRSRRMQDFMTRASSPMYLSDGWG